MHDPKCLVAQGYDSIAERYTVWAQRVRAEERARYTHLLLQTLPAHATPLELGRGAGLPTTRTLAQHFRVLGVDISAQQLARAKRHVPTATFLHADMTGLAFTRPCFDAVVAFYSLMHVPAVGRGTGRHHRLLGTAWRVVLGHARLGRPRGGAGSRLAGRAHVLE